MTRVLPPLAVSLGDPAGVGPELIAAAWARRRELALPPFAVVGGAEVLAAAAERRGIVLPVARIAGLAEADAAFDRSLPVLGRADAAYTPGLPHPEGARLALASLQQGAALALAGEAAGLVTMPVAKAGLAEIGFAHPGQTEFLAQACGVDDEDAVMMLAGPSLRAVPVTIHCPLAEVPGRLSSALIAAKGRIVIEALRRDFGIANPRVAVCGLNPHAGEHGRIGHEDAEIIAPAVAALIAEGVDATGPHPADALFSPRARAGYDAALAMYHDQALIPVKALDFDQGVNVTLGLPIVRTSPDHGTAFDIAGEGVADESATIAAIRMAAAIAALRAITSP
ncbi:4-hydroxythreonine-4-phosphate dehydrogenase PdxA [Qipengyuania sediminis]|uniref:4-hydroxythreonine-4-phosphate dehydrogenase PdxA n=1 Tax=Qipengyuania sediminis TaxID=1532023 RepID=UPI001059DC33|nr:4-hydroxythreonine-4-phosphate dehydrogenase PdxA [Qipengyuania sediminis]